MKLKQLVLAIVAAFVLGFGAFTLGVITERNEQPPIPIPEPVPTPKRTSLVLVRTIEPGSITVELQEKQQ